jgi:ketosteroid isomerase-like protein
MRSGFFLLSSASSVVEVRWRYSNALLPVTSAMVLVVLVASVALAARGESPAAFGRRCIPADCVAPPSHIPDMLGRRALSSGRLAALVATPDFHHGLLAQSGSGTEQELREAVRKYIAGYASNTVDGYFDHYAPDVTMWWPNGLRQEREAYRKSWSDSLQRGMTVESAEFDDLRIHPAPSGDAGVASFLWKIKRKGGEPYALQTSTTFFKRDGKWQIVHMHFNRAGSSGGSARPGNQSNAPNPSNAPAASSTRPQQASQPNPAEQELRGVISKLTATYGANDLDGYFALYAPELTWWGPGGRSDRESYRTFWADYIKTTGGLQSADTSDLRIQASPKGDLAVASYLLKVIRRNPGPNRSANVTYEMSPTLVKRGGSWTIVHLHFQVVPEPRAASQHD